MSLWELEVTQTDCPHVRATRKYPSLRIVVLGTEVTGRHEKIFSVFSCPTTRELSRALSSFQRSSGVKEFRLLSAKSGVATALYLMRKTSLFKKTARIGLRIHPLVVKEGHEKWYLISGQSKESIRLIANDEFTRVVSIRRQKPAEIFKLIYSAARYLMPALSISSNLTRGEIELLRAAQTSGFYSWPRRTSLTSLSEKLGMPKSTLSYRFRRVEKKLADALS